MLASNFKQTGTQGGKLITSHNCPIMRVPRRAAGSRLSEEEVGEGRVGEDILQA